VGERLARYGSSALSGLEHLRLLVGRDSGADSLLRHFGSLRALGRASFRELRQFLTKREAEAVVAELAMPTVVDAEEALAGRRRSIVRILKCGICDERWCGWSSWTRRMA
jgi:DNA repair protein RadC